MIVKNILLRHEANAEKDPAKQKELIQEADDLRAKAIAIQKGAKAAAAAPAPQVEVGFGPSASAGIRATEKGLTPSTVSALLAFQPLGQRCQLPLLGVTPRRPVRMPSVTMPTFSTPAPLAASMTATISP